MEIKIKNSNKLKELLIIKGFSQRQLASEINLSYPYFNQIINQEKPPSPKVAKNICDKLETKFEDIFFIENACK